MTQGQVILALVTLAVATIVYRWQKSIDRDVKVAEEKRSAYQKFFEAAELYFAELRMTNSDDSAKLPKEQFAKLEAAKAEISYRCSKIGISDCAQFSQALKDYRKNLKIWIESGRASEGVQKDNRDRSYLKTLDARIVAIMSARKDARIDFNDDDAEAAIRELFFTPKEGASQ